MLTDFKKFILRGNIVDMATGVIIGGAFGKIVTSLVNDILMPVIGMIIGGIDFSSLKIILSPGGIDSAGNAIAEVAINFGAFLQQTVDFLIIAVCIFGILKALSRFKKKEETPPAPPAGPTTEELLAEILAEIKK